jgi:hypothetical protein
MAENDIDEIDDEDVDETPQQLREAANRSKQHKAEADAARRELAFVKAGIDTDSKLGKLVFTTYDGELTADAIKEFVADIPGLGTPAAPPPVENEDEDEEVNDGSTFERDALANDAQGDTGGTPDPRKVGRDAAKSVVESGGTQEDALATHFQQIVGAAKSGDKRVIVS